MSLTFNILMLVENSKCSTVHCHSVYYVLKFIQMYQWQLLHVSYCSEEVPLSVTRHLNINVRNTGMHSPSVLFWKHF